MTEEEKEIIALFYHRSETEENTKSENIGIGNALVIWYMMLLEKRGWGYGEKDLKILLKSCEEKKIRLPKSFLQFFQTPDFQARFRTEDLSFIPFARLTSFPEEENYYITPFFGGSQGSCYWYLLLNKASEYCILYNNFHLAEIDNRLPEEPEPEFIVCADSFEEFLVRLVEDIKIQEEGKWEEKFKARFPQYFNRTPKELLEQFPEDRKLLKKIRFKQ